jgi:hypothetical protein
MSVAVGVRPVERTARSLTNLNLPPAMNARLSRRRCTG